MLSGSGVWVGFIISLGMFIWSDVSMAFVMRWLAVWGSSWRGVFLRVCSMCCELGPVGFSVVSESSQGFSCGYFSFVFECDEDGKMVGVQAFKCLPSEVGRYCGVCCSDVGEGGLLIWVEW